MKTKVTRSPRLRPGIDSYSKLVPKNLLSRFYRNTSLEPTPLIRKFIRNCNMAVRTVPVIAKAEWYSWIKNTIGDNIAGPALIEVLEFAIKSPAMDILNSKLGASLVTANGDLTFSGQHYAVDSRGYHLVVGIISATSSMERMILIHRVCKSDDSDVKLTAPGFASMLLVGNRSVVCLTSSDDYVD